MQYILLYFIYFFISVYMIHGFPKLLFANRKDIRVISYQKGKLSRNILVKNVNDVASVDYYYDKQGVCWTDIGSKLIKCVSVNQMKEKSDIPIIKIITGGISSPNGMAVDWLTGKIYWTDSETDKIEVAEMFGQNRKVLYWKDLDQPRAIALVPSEGIMFWSDWGESARLEMAGMDGDSFTRKVIVNKDILWPNGLTVDYDNRKLFWADGKSYSISAVDFDGSGRVKVVDSLKHPFALTYFQSTLFWTDWRTETIHYCHLNKKIKCEEEKQLLLKQSPMCIHAYDQSRQMSSDTPCRHDNGGCSHLCLLSPSPNRFTCSCPTGVNLINETTCANGPKEMLLLARRSDLRIISLDTADRTPVVIPVSNVHHAVAVDFDPVEGFFYWTDDEAFLIQRARLNGSAQEIVIQSDGLDADGVAVDWLARNLYWSDAKHNWIEVAKLDGSSRKILIRGDLDKPRAIALFPEGGLMFWTDWGNQSKIERSYLDGSNRLTIVDTGLGWPNGVAVDRVDLKVYWVDAKTQRIEVSEFDGSERTIILMENLPHVFGFSLHGDFLYWTDWQKRSVERFHKYNASFREIIVEQLPDVMGLKALSFDQEWGYSPCVEDNGGCSHLCFNRPKGEHVCDCPLGYELAPNALDCIVPFSYLIYAQTNVIARVSLVTFASTILPMPEIKQATSIAHDGDGRLYWSDYSSKSIFRSFMNGSHSEVVVEFGLAYPDGLTVDWLAGHLYWSDVVNNKIEVSKLDGSSRKVVLWSLSSPKSLLVDSLRGFIYWTEKHDKVMKIMKAFLDGSLSVSLLDKRGSISDMTLDTDVERLFWADQERGTLNTIDFNGRNVKVIMSHLQQPTSVVVHEDFMYWFDASDESIQRARKYSGAQKETISTDLGLISDLLIFENSRKNFDSDENPCLHKNGFCSHLCFFIPASKRVFTCDCPTHWTLASDGRTCLPPTTFLILSQAFQVTRLPLNSTLLPSSVLPISHLKNVHSVAFGQVSRSLFWIDSESHSILKSSLSGSDRGVLVKAERSAPFDLVLDSLSGIVFWSCLKNDVINATKTDGTQVGVVFSMEKLVKPRYLALHSELSIIFFTNDVTPPTIDKLDLKNLGREIVIKAKLISLIALTVDTMDNALYWVDIEPVTIQTADLNGRNRKILIDSELHRPLSLAVLSDQLYWIDAEAKSVEKVNKFSGQDREVVMSKVSQMTDIISVSGHLNEFSVNHSCLHEGKKCSHICLRSSFSLNYPYMPHLNGLIHYTEGFASAYYKDAPLPFQCQCPLGMALSSDRFTCLPKPICSSNQFTCISGQNCIPLHWRCNDLKECPDGSDEMGCSAHSCGSSLYRCANGKCIENVLVCDSIHHCSDGSDELRCCPPSEALCLSTGLCSPCSAPERCPEPMPRCPFPITHLHGGISRDPKSSRAPYIVGVFASVLVLVCVVASAFYYRRKPTLLDEDSGDAHQVALKDTARSRPHRVLLSGGQVYTGLEGNAVPVCFHNSRNRCPPHPNMCPKAVDLSGNRINGVPCGICANGAASSSSSSMTHYPRETLNPPPTPVEEPLGHCQDPHCCCYSAGVATAPVTALNSYRHYKAHNRPPPPTPCSTIAYDDSDFYSSARVSPQNSRCLSPPFTCYSSPFTDYDSEPLPPPPTPLTASYPPSPSTERSYFIQAPCSTPISNSMSE